MRSHRGCGATWQSSCAAWHAEHALRRNLSPPRPVPLSGSVCRMCGSLGMRPAGTEAGIARRIAAMILLHEALAVLPPLAEALQGASSELLQVGCCCVLPGRVWARAQGPLRSPSSCRSPPHPCVADGGRSLRACRLGRAAGAAGERAGGGRAEQPQHLSEQVEGGGALWAGNLGCRPQACRGTCPSPAPFVQCGKAPHPCRPALTPQDPTGICSEGWRGRIPGCGPPDLLPRHRTGACYACCACRRCWEWPAPEPPLACFFIHPPVLSPAGA